MAFFISLSLLYFDCALYSLIILLHCSKTETEVNDGFRTLHCRYKSDDWSKLSKTCIHTFTDELQNAKEPKEKKTLTFFVVVVVYVLLIYTWLFVIKQTHQQNFFSVHLSISSVIHHWKIVSHSFNETTATRVSLHFSRRFICLISLFSAGVNQQKRSFCQSHNKTILELTPMFFFWCRCL